MATVKEKYIRPKASRWELGLKEIWEYRELLYFLTLKQIKTKYKQTAIGIGWAILQPLLTTIIFAVIFYNVAGLSTGGVAGRLQGEVHCLIDHDLMEVVDRVGEERDPGAHTRLLLSLPGQE